MSAIQVQILAGPATGRTGSFIDPPVTFGRNADNAIVLDTPLASRQHGALVFHEGDWCVINQSTNGTTVNGRKVGERPQPVKHGDVVGVGKQKLFRIAFEQTTYETADGAAADAGDEPIVSDERTEAAKKMKLWIGIGIYVFVMLIGFVVLTQVIGGEEGNGASQNVAQLSDEQIAQEIRTPLKLPLDERAAREALAEAQRQYERRDVDRSALFRAHRNFKKSLAHAGLTSFSDGMVIRQFRACEEQLVTRINERYDECLHLRRSQQWTAAEQALRQLLEMYPDNRSRIYRNAIEQLKLVQARRSR